MEQVRNVAATMAATASAASPAKPPPAAGAFQALLDEHLGTAKPVNFSRHAEDRMRARNVELSQEDQGRLAQAVDKAAGKGARESLVLLDRLAFVVNVPSRTVVTAVPAGSTKGGVFTRIDSAVLA